MSVFSFVLILFGVSVRVDATLPHHLNHLHNNAHHQHLQRVAVGPGGIAVVQMVGSMTTSPNNTTATFGNGILPTARQPGEDWPFTSTTSRARILSAKAPPINMPLPIRTINYTAYFDNFEAKFKDGQNKQRPNETVRHMAPNKIVGEMACDVSSTETVKVFLILQHGHYLTTVLKPTLVARRKLVVDDKTFDFDITLQLHQWNTSEKVVTGAQFTQTITEGRFTANPSITLRWPIEYRSLVKFDSLYNLADPKSTSSMLAIDVSIILAHPNNNNNNNNSAQQSTISVTSRRHRTGY